MADDPSGATPTLAPPVPDPTPPVDLAADEAGKWREHSRKWEDRAKANAKAAKERDALQARLDELAAADQTEHEKALAAARKEADEAARADERAKWSKAIVAAQVQVAASGKLADPTDAVALLDLSDFTVDDDGNVDRSTLDGKLDELLERKPHLKAASTPPTPAAAGQPQGAGFDGGARPPAATGGIAAGRERGRKAREDAAKQTRDPFAGMTVIGGTP